MTSERRALLTVAGFMALFVVFFGLLWFDEQKSPEEIAFYARQKLDAEVRAAEPEGITVGNPGNIRKACDSETGNIVYWHHRGGGVAVVPGGCAKVPQ